MNGNQALQNAKQNKNRATSKYYKTYEGIAELDFKPKFKFNKDTSFFTIGSCFARNVENYLMQKKVPLLSKMPNVSGEYFAAGGKDRSGYQNVYTPGSVLEASRLVALEDRSHAIAEVNGLYYDLITHGLKGLEEANAVAIREAMLDVYQNIKHTDVMVITLGYTEAWYYKPANAWVNQSPANPKLRALSEDFELVVFDFEKTKIIIEEALSNFRKVNANIKFVITVSPVPLGSTFTEDHILVANQRSKSTLHTVAHQLTSTFNDVDYFPSYEIVSLSNREIAFEEDNIHVRSTMVAKVMDCFFKQYFES
ncbi:GSCFA domain-containing protein [Alteromonas gracilis]|uniref:GSCFA domain-containing protein n=1 Tax=Alteromonas gracilis TaxID=1479524 RepID=UPI002FE2E82C